jgi:hypothetical protein
LAFLDKVALDYLVHRGETLFVGKYQAKEGGKVVCSNYLETGALTGYTIAAWK